MKPIKYWANTEEDTENFFNYLRANGCKDNLEWAYERNIVGGNRSSIGWFVNQDDLVTFVRDKEYFDRQKHEEFFFATPVHETEDGWFINNTGKCPLDPNTRIDVRYRDGQELYDVPAQGSFSGRDTGASFWQLDGAVNDIVAWQYAEKGKTPSADEWVEDSSNEVLEVDMVNNPKHYTSHPSGIECIEITRHMSFNLGNATKYIWRCDLKKDAIEDLKKAVFYLNDEIALREKL